MKKLYQILTLLLLLVLSNNVISQLSRTHYIPPFYAVNDGSTTAQEQELYITTPHDTAIFTLTTGDGTVIMLDTVLQGEYKSWYDIGYGTPFICDDTELNTIITDKGFILTSDSAVYANMRITAGSLGNPSQAGSLTSKGIFAYGTTYRLGAMPNLEDHNRKASCFSIMATEDATDVTINFKSPQVVFDGVGGPDPTVPLNITLNKGETYTAAIHIRDAIGNLDTGITGSLITSTKPIAVNTGSWAGSLRNNAGADVGFDQIVDASLVGNEYVMVRGQGEGANDDDMEQVMIVAHEDATDIFVNGNIVPIATINAGEYFLIDGSNYINEGMHVSTSKDAYCYQFIMGADNSSNTQGMNFVPPISCYTSQEINNIPVVDSIGVRKYTGGLTIITRAGSSILVNGGAPGVTPIDIIGQYEAYKIEGLAGAVTVTTNSVALVGFFGFSGAAGYGGYYSGFDEVTFNSGVSDDCPPGIMTVSANLTVDYQWHLNNVPIPGETNDSLNFTQEGDYYVVFDRNGCKDTSGVTTIFPLPSVDMGDDFSICDNFDTTLVLTPSAGTDITWLGVTTSNSYNIDSAGVYWVELNNLNGCFDTDTLIVGEVTIDPISFTGCLPDTLFTASNDTTGGVFRWHNDFGVVTENDSVVPVLPGTYHATITTSVCTDSTNFVVIHPQPEVNMGSDFIICENYDTVLTLAPPAGITMAWFGTDTVDTAIVAGPGQFWVELSNDNGCVKYDTLTISALTDTVIVSDCVPGTITVNSNANGTYQWFQNNNSLTTSTSNTVSTEDTGSYHYIVTTSICRDTSDVITVDKSNFTTDLLEEFDLCRAWDTLVTVHHSPEVSIFWMGDIEGDSYIINDEGEYWIEIADINDCKEYDTVRVTHVDCSPRLVMPNVLSLSSSVNNRFLPIVSINVLDEIDLRVYNRWGMKVAHEVLLRRGWDGTVRGIPVTPGTYFWTITYKSLDDNGISTHTENGFVQIVQ